ATAYSDQFDLYTGNSNPELARKIARYLGRELGHAEVFEFANENIFVRIEDNARDRDVFVIQPTSRPVQKSIMELLNVIGAVKGRRAIIVDDEIDTASTLMEIERALIREGVTEIYACATHGILSDPATDRLRSSEITEIVITDTVPLTPSRRLPQ